ncbi:MAG: protein kinase [Thermoanaerobaculales bacterium]|nr:protein kinase [Thermoanaerobaculales bacterium]
MDRIGHYTIVSELGRGGMGVVYKAHEESLNRFVAIKVLGEHLEADDEYVQRFVREARSAAALSHPNIVQIYAIAEEDGHHYFVMEYVQGTSVQRMIQTRGKLEPADAARLVLQAAAGLQDAHAQGVIHRDIKPANLMVTDRGLVKIADFGLALMGSATSRLTATGMLMGTPGYLSPEQCLDQGPDHRTDIYSLGVTFFEMVTGTMPFRADSPLALLKQIVEVEPPDVRELNPGVDDGLRTIIVNMIEKDREQRYDSCTEIIAAVQGWLQANDEPLQSAGSGTAAGVLPPPPPAATEEQINTDPTIAVDSGATEEPAPSVPPPPASATTAPATPAETAPAPQPDTSPPAQPARRKTGLIVAAVVLFLIASGAVAAVLVFKSGILDPVFNRGESRFAEVANPVDAEIDPIQTSTVVDSTSPPDGGSPAAGAEIGAASPEREPETSTGGQSSTEPETAATTSPTSGTDGPSPGAPSSSATMPKSSAPAHSSATGASSGAASEPAEPLAPAAADSGTVVLAVGDRLLAAEAEVYVKGRLERAGVDIVDVTSIPGLEGFIDTEARPGPERVRAIIRPHARFMVPIRVQLVGSREVVYMGQRDVVHQARVNLTAVDLASGRRLGRAADVTIEFTELNAREKVEEGLRRATTGLLQQVPRD